MKNNVNKNPVLKIDGLRIEFIKSGLVTDFKSFEINKGDFVLLKGRNGSGKSTLLRLINLNFDGGKAYCKVLNGNISYYKKNGEEIVSTSREITKDDFVDLRRNIVEVRQDENFASFLTPKEALSHSTKIAIEGSDLSESEKKEKLHYLDDLVLQLFKGYELDNGDVLSLNEILNNCSERDFVRKKLKAFSGGQQKMIQVIAGFVKAKVTNANLILLDEPANNLDGKNKYYLNLLFKELYKTGNIAILMISHCHVFDDINKIVDVDYSDLGFKAETIIKTADNQKKFEPHHDCIEDCENKIRKILGK